MRKKIYKSSKTQAILEYAILFAVVLAALIGSAVISDAQNSLKDNFQDMAQAMAGESLESSSIGGWE